jgi:hypothetical protein
MKTVNRDSRLLHFASPAALSAPLAVPKPAPEELIVIDNPAEVAFRISPSGKALQCERCSSAANLYGPVCSENIAKPCLSRVFLEQSNSISPQASWADPAHHVL